MIKEFNAMKSLLISRGNRFTKEEFLGMLGTIDGIPKYPNVFACMQPDILYKTFHGNRRAGEPALYSFKNTDPVYYAVLDRAIENCKKITNKYKSKSLKKNKVAKVEHIQSDIAQAIALLKANGYKIMKPSVTYEEI